MVFTLTDIGKNALAGLLSGETLELTSVIITDGYTTGISEVETASDLEGNTVFSDTISGTVSGDTMHIEFSDSSTTEYTAKTMAVSYTQGGSDYILAVSANSTKLFQKGSMPLYAVIDIKFEDASSISFDSATIAFPQATDTTNGTVRYATAEEISSKTGDGVLTAGMLDQIINLIVGT